MLPWLLALAHATSCLLVAPTVAPGTGAVTPFVRPMIAFDGWGTGEDVRLVSSTGAAMGLRVVAEGPHHAVAVPERPLPPGTAWTVGFEDQVLATWTVVAAVPQAPARPAVPTVTRSLHHLEPPAAPDGWLWIGPRHAWVEVALGDLPAGVAYREVQLRSRRTGQRWSRATAGPVARFADDLCPPRFEDLRPEDPLDVRVRAVSAGGAVGPWRGIHDPGPQPADPGTLAGVVGAMGWLMVAGASLGVGRHGRVARRNGRAAHRGRTP